jgi:hypothetical protein
MLYNSYIYWSLFVLGCLWLFVETRPMQWLFRRRQPTKFALWMSRKVFPWVQIAGALVFMWLIVEHWLHTGGG